MLLLDFSRYSISDIIAQIPRREAWQLAIADFLEWWSDTAADNLHIKTSGSTGAPKLYIFSKNDLLQSAQATVRFFDLQPQNTALLCLSADFIAGKMMLVRAIVARLRLYCTAPRSLPLSDGALSFDFVAMVPAQVLETLQKNAALWQQVRCCIVGGAALSAAQIAALQSLPTRFYATFGMTETLSHIAVRALNGVQVDEYYQALPNIFLRTDERSCLCIRAPYLPHEIISNDIVDLQADKVRFRFLGRADSVINSGGIKIIPELLEAKIAQFIAVPFYFAGKNDEKWGQKLVLYIENTPFETQEMSHLCSVLLQQLQRYEQPKEIVFRTAFERTATGKIKRIAF